jgi:hypothetical protein
VKVFLFLLIKQENPAFIEKVDHYRNLKNSTNRYLEATKIMFSFIQPLSQYELNLPSTYKMSINNQFTNCSEDDCPVNLFDEVSKLIFYELEKDNFGSFTQTPLWLKFLKKNQHFIKDILADDDEELDHEMKRGNVEKTEVKKTNQKITKFSQTTKPNIQHSGMIFFLIFLRFSIIFEFSK